MGEGSKTEGEARASGVPSEIRAQASSISTLLAPRVLYFSFQSFEAPCSSVSVESIQDADQEVTDIFVYFEYF